MRDNRSRLAFGKALATFDFAEKLTQNNSKYLAPKDFLCLHFAVDVVLLVSEYDLENKNAVSAKILNWRYGIKDSDFDFFSAFAYFADRQRKSFELFCVSLSSKLKATNAFPNANLEWLPLMILFWCKHCDHIKEH